MSADHVMVLGYGPQGQGSIPSRGKRFFSTSVPRPAMGSTWPPVQWLLETISLGVKCLSVKLTTPPASAKVKNGKAIPPLPHTSLWHDA
jgi:hypothetical protein